MRLFKSRMRQWAKDEGGATAIEYGLIAGLMVLAIIGSLYSFGDANDEMYKTIEENLVGV